MPHARARAAAGRAEAVAGGERAGVGSLLPLKSTLSREFRSLMVKATDCISYRPFRFPSPGILRCLRLLFPSAGIYPVFRQSRLDIIP